MFSFTIYVFFFLKKIAQSSDAAASYFLKYLDHSSMRGYRNVDNVESIAIDLKKNIYLNPLQDIIMSSAH